MSRMLGRIESCTDSESLAGHVAEWMTAAALEAKGDFRVSHAGGPTPRVIYGLLASDAFRERFPWQRVSWFWGDERFVPYAHQRSAEGRVGTAWVITWRIR